MALHPLSAWTVTRDSLHRAAQVVGAFRKVGVEADPKFFQHHALKPIPQGLSSQPTQFGEIILDFGQGAVIYNGQILSLADYHQVSLADALLKLIREAGHDPQLRDPFTDETPLAIDSKLSLAYAETLYTIYQALEGFRAGLPNFTTPVVVYPHHFDLSFLWFPAKHEDEYDQHINFGFAPFSDGIDDPYFYTYAYPVPDGYKAMTLPDGVHWAEKWTGTLQPYIAVLGQTDPVAAFMAGFQAIYAETAALFK